MTEKAMTLWSLKQTPVIVTPDIKIEGELDDGSARIRCPQCDWRPSPSSRWACLDSDRSPEPRFEGCGTSWNTFDTRGRCPSCAHQWRWTVCLRCSSWSLHIDWYEISTRQ